MLKSQPFVTLLLLLVCGNAVSFVLTNLGIKRLRDTSVSGRLGWKLKLSLDDFVTNDSVPDQFALGSIVSSDLLNTLQNTAIIVSGILYFAYEGRPRGSARDDLLEVRKSKLIKNNLGVFAKTFIPAGTVIGTYPGYIKTLEAFTSSSTS